MVFSFSMRRSSIHSLLPLFFEERQSNHRPIQSKRYICYGKSVITLQDALKILKPRFPIFVCLFSGRDRFHIAISQVDILAGGDADAVEVDP